MAEIALFASYRYTKWDYLTISGITFLSLSYVNSNKFPDHILAERTSSFMVIAGQLVSSFEN